MPLEQLELEASGGIFGCYNIDPPLVTGTLDSYLAAATPTDSYEAVTSSVSAGGHWAWGWVFGAKATYFVKGQLGIAVGANYYLGGGDLNLSGSYDAFDQDAVLPPLDNEPLPSSLRNARLDFSGLEIILGVEIAL